MANFFTGGALKGIGHLLMGESGIKPSINLFNQLSLQQQQMLNRALGMQQLGINQNQAAFGAAKNAVLQSKGAAKTEARDAGTQAYGAASNSAVSRGLTNTSSLDAVNRGIGSDLAKHMAWIDAQAGQQLGALDIGQAQALNQGYGQMGNLYTQFGQNNAALAGPLMGQIAQGQPGILGPLMQMGGMAMAGGMFSDPRLKKNISFEGMLHVRGYHSIPVYTYEYKDPDCPGRFLGVMAPDVKHLEGVVSKSKSGYLQVDYVKLEKLTGFRFRKLRRGEKAKV